MIDLLECEICKKSSNSLFQRVPSIEHTDNLWTCPTCINNRDAKEIKRCIPENFYICLSPYPYGISPELIQKEGEF